VTSWLFPDAVFSEERCRKLSTLVGRERLVIDLSCRRENTEEGPRWYVGKFAYYVLDLILRVSLSSVPELYSTEAMNRWQTRTSLEITRDTLISLARYASEFLVHAADVEGLCQGNSQSNTGELTGWINCISVVTLYRH
jgi:phosphoribosylformimino-5-aminoimidazole carboxamide ribotide isomerase